MVVSARVGPKKSVPKKKMAGVVEKTFSQSHCTTTSFRSSARSTSMLQPPPATWSRVKGRLLPSLLMVEASTAFLAGGLQEPHQSTSHGLGRRAASPVIGDEVSPWATALAPPERRAFAGTCISTSIKGNATPTPRRAYYSAY